MKVSYEKFQADCAVLAERITNRASGIPIHAIYGIPRGGVIVAQQLAYCLDLPITDDIEAYGSVLIVDDLVDSGLTMKRILKKFPHNPTVALYVKTNTTHTPLFYAQSVGTEWIEFWYEKEEAGGIEDSVRRMIQFIGDNPDREGLRETPARVAKAMKFMCSGTASTDEEVEKLIKTFSMQDGEYSYDEMIIVKDIEVYSMCEHHMLPFFGKAHVGYIPNGKVIGVSKIARIVDLFSRRLQVQERLTAQVTEAIKDAIDPMGVGCVIEAKHLCMMMRGVQKQNSTMTTSSLSNKMREPTVRAEFLRLIG